MGILKTIKDANPTRDFANLERRVLKLGEEYGELCQALLSVTGSNHKNQTIEDLREEIIDVFIVATDILYTVLPEENSNELKTIIEKQIEYKINKWHKTMQNNAFIKNGAT